MNSQFICPVWPEVGDELYCTLKLTNRDRLIALPARDSDMQEIVVDATPSMRNKNVNGRVYRSLQVGSFVLTDEHFPCIFTSYRKKRASSHRSTCNGTNY